MTMFAAAAMLLAAAPAMQDQQQFRPDDEIIVRAPTEQAIEEFVARIGDPVSKRNGYARWDQRICPGIVGLDRDAAIYFADRVAIVATQARLKVGGPGCFPDLMVAFTSDPQRIADLVAQRYSSKFQRAVDRPRLEAFQNSTAPVRTLHFSLVGNYDGTRTDPDPLGPPSTRGIRASRITQPFANYFHGAIVVVDTNQVRGVSYQQLSAYIALLGLAMIDPESEANDVASIVTLFSDRDSGRRPVNDITNWDIAYLQGLYTGTHALTAGRKEAGISVRMKHELARAAKLDEDRGSAKAQRTAPD